MSGAPSSDDGVERDGLAATRSEPRTARGGPRPAASSDAAAVGDVPPEALGILSELAGFNLRIAYGRASAVFQRRFEEMELAPIQFAALECIARSGGHAQTEIAERVGTAPSVLVTPLERLEARGLIERGRDPADRRRAVVWITASGTELLDRAREVIRDVEDELLEGLSAWEREQLLDLLTKVTGR